MDDNRQRQQGPRTPSVRLSDEEINALLDSLDRVDGETADKAQPPSYTYRQPALHLDLWQLGGSTFVPYTVPTRRLNATGLSFLSGNYLHPGALCRVKLLTLPGTWIEVEGVVQSCRHVRSHAHDVELQFMKQIDPSLFCSEAVPCHVMLVEDDPLTARMIGAWLTQLNATVRHVPDGQPAIELASQERFDLILLDMQLPTVDGLATARALRAAGYGGRLVGMSAITNPELARLALDGGCDQFLPKPFDRAALAQVLRLLREEPILSTYHDDESVAALITAFATELPEQVRSIQEAIARRDLRTANRIVSDLKAQSGMYGFEIIATLTAEIQAAVADDALIVEIDRKVRELAKVCDRVRSPAGRSRPALDK